MTLTFFRSLFVVGFKKICESWHKDGFAGQGLNPRKQVITCEPGSGQTSWVQTVKSGGIQFRVVNMDSEIILDEQRQVHEVERNR